MHENHIGFPFKYHSPQVKDAVICPNHKHMHLPRVGIKPGFYHKAQPGGFYGFYEGGFLGF